MKRFFIIDDGRYYHSAKGYVIVTDNKKDAFNTGSRETLQQIINLLNIISKERKWREVIESKS